MPSEHALEKNLLHYMTKAVHDYRMIPKGSRLLVCLSGGKDSYTMTYLLNKMRIASKCAFSMHVFVLDQSQPGWQDQALRAWLTQQHLPHTILTEDTYSIVMDKVPAGKTYCSLCSRLRRGIIYRYAKEHGYSHIALGHHRDDAIVTLLMSLFYNGKIKSMPPKLLTDDQHHMVIRPMIYCQEQVIKEYAKTQAFPIIPCNLCGNQENLKRQQTQAWLNTLSASHPNIPSNLLHALQSVAPSQLMDRDLWDFHCLDQQLIPFKEHAK